jgi:hypothetical protein
MTLGVAARQPSESGSPTAAGSGSCFVTMVWVVGSCSMTMGSRLRTMARQRRNRLTLNDNAQGSVVLVPLLRCAAGHGLVAVGTNQVQSAFAPSVRAAIRAGVFDAGV